MPSSDDRFLLDCERNLLAAAKSLGCTRFDVSPIWYRTGWSTADFRTACAMGWTPLHGWPPGRASHSRPPGGGRHHIEARRDVLRGEV